MLHIIITMNNNVQSKMFVGRFLNGQEIDDHSIKYVHVCS